MLILVIHVHAGDEHHVHKNLDLAFKFDGKQDAHVLVASDDKAVMERTAEYARRCFSKVDVFLYDMWKGDKQWPIIQNHAWQKVAYYMDVAELNPMPSGWFWWESDAMPIRPGWLKTISETHEKGGKAFSGVSCSDTKTPFYQNGVGVWPMRPSNYLATTTAMYIRSASFDREAGAAVKANHTSLNHLMIHDVKPFGGSVGTCFLDRSEVDQLLEANPKSVFFHGCADGSLTKLLLGETLASDSHPNRSSLGGGGVMPTRFSISVLCYNNLEFTRRCIASILLYSNDYELIVTDNASTDGTANYLSLLKKRMGDHLTVINNEENKGFNEPSNEALRIAKGEYFVLLNNDMETCSGWLDNLARPLERSSVALVGLSGTCQSITKDFHGSAGGNLEYIEGSCMMGRTEQLRQFGLFSDYLKFAYYEDVDLSLRMREAGYELATVALPMKHHTRGNTSVLVEKEGKIPIKEYVAHNKAEMKKRWGHYLTTRSFKPPGSICLHRRGANGDVLLLTPVLRALHNKWPSTQLFVETDCPQVLAGLPVTATNKKVNADVRIELDGTYEADPSKHIVEVYADKCGVQLEENWRPEIHRGMYMRIIENVWGTRVGIHTKTHWPGKKWPEERWNRVKEYCKEEKHFEIYDVDSFDGSATSLAGMLEYTDLFIGVDSFPAHVAQAVGKHAIILFGTTNPDCIVCPNASTTVLRGDPRLVKCIGEHGRRTRPMTMQPPCDGACMRAITVEMVINAIDEWHSKQPTVAQRMKECWTMPEPKWEFRA